MDHFQSPFETLSWADSNIQQLEQITLALKNAGSRVVIETDPGSGNKTYKMVLDYAIPKGTSRLISEAIVHCRHCLDQACVAAWKGSNGGDAPRDIYFPFPNSAADLDGRIKSTSLNKLPAQALERIRSAQPYPARQPNEGGNVALVALNDAAKRKHSVVAKLNCQITSMNMSNATFVGVVSQMVFPVRWDNEKNEAIICVTAPDGYAHFDIGITGKITCDGAGMLDGGPIALNLRAIYNECRAIIESIRGSMS